MPCRRRAECVEGRACASAEPARDVVFGLFALAGEDISVSHQTRSVRRGRRRPCSRRSGGLLHVVGDDHDRVAASRSSWISSSILAVAIGSRRKQGSSIRSTSGSTARARAMQSRCCCPPERTLPGPEIVFHFVPERGHPQRLLSRSLSTERRALRSSAARRPRFPRSTSWEKDSISGRPSRRGGGPSRDRAGSIKIFSVKKDFPSSGAR